MTTVAAGAYLRTLREARHYSRARLASAAGTHPSQIERIEKGEQDSRGSLLFAIVQALQGSVEQVGLLILDESATAEDGMRLAQVWLSQEAQKELSGFAASIPDEHIAAVVEQIERLQANPEALFRLRGYVERLVEEQLEDQPQSQPKQSGKWRHLPWRRK